MLGATCDKTTVSLISFDDALRSKVMRLWGNGDEWNRDANHESIVDVYSGRGVDVHAKSEPIRPGFCKRVDV